MATTTTSGVPLSRTAPATLRASRRRITPEAGRALEILGHSIEYLTDEFVHEGGTLGARDSRLDAIRLLMSLNREIYYACPVVPTFAERCLAFLGL